MTLTIKQGDTLYKVQEAIRIVSNEEDIEMFSDELFEKCHALYEYIFYMMHPMNPMKIGRCK